MSRRDWLHRIAVGGLIVAALCGFAPTASKQPLPITPQQIGASRLGQNEQQTPPMASPEPKGAGNSQAPEEGCKGTSQPSLSCDAIAAQAAIDQARDADQQAAAGWWGLGVGSLTLVAAVFAALYARGAVIEGKRSADAAHEALKDARAGATEQTERFNAQLKVAQDSADAAKAAADAMTHANVIAETTSENNLRPWLSFRILEHTQTKMGGKNVTIFCKIEIENHGRFPAEKADIHSFAYPSNGAIMTFDPFTGPAAISDRLSKIRGPEYKGGNVISPGEKVTVAHTIMVNEDKWRAAAAQHPGAGVDLFGFARLVYDWRGKTAFLEKPLIFRKLDPDAKPETLNADPHAACAEKLLITAYGGRVGDGPG